MLLVMLYILTVYMYRVRVILLFICTKIGLSFIGMHVGVW